MSKRKTRSPSSQRGTRYLKTHERRRLRWLLWNEQHGFCAICGNEMELDEVTIDHIIPVSKGGRNRRANMRAAHLHCNSKRRDGPSTPLHCDEVYVRPQCMFGTMPPEDEDE